MRDTKPNRAMIEPLEERRLLSVQQFADLAPAGLNPRDLTPFDNELLFFTTSTDENLLQLWASDGTDKGTKLLKNFGPDDSVLFSDNENLVRSGDYAYFADDIEGVPALWRTDGTANGTVLLKQFGQDDQVLGLTDYQGELMFSTKGTLWKSDGTSDGTVSVAQVSDPSTWPGSMMVAGDWLYFRGGSGDTAGLWRSDGTAEGTSLYAALTSSWGLLGAVGDTFYFSKATEDPESQELWRVDPMLGIIEVGVIGSPSLFTAIDGKAWFVARNPVGTALESIWWTDGTTLHRAYTSSSENVSLSNLIGIGNEMLFVSETYSSSSSSSGTTIIFQPPPPPPFSAELLSLDTAHNNSVQSLKSLGTFSGYGFINSLKIGNQAVYMLLPDPLNGASVTYLYKSDGTSVGTMQFTKAVMGSENTGLFNFNSSGPSISPMPVDLNGKLFFSAADSAGQFWLSSSDLTPAGTHIVYESGVVAGDDFSNMLTIGGTLYFATFENTNSSSQTWIWKTDGVHQPNLIRMFDSTTGGNPALFSIGQTMAVVVNGDLWALSNGGKLVQITSNLNLSNFSLLSQTPTRDYFMASQGSDVYLWTTDGTAKGTIRLYSKKWHGNGYTQYFDPTEFLGRLYFILQPAGSSQRQLWSTDGTQAGTVRVTNLAGTFINPSPTKITAFGKKLCYLANDTNGVERLWITDGTKAGTFRLANAAVEDVTQAGSNLYFWFENKNDEPVIYKSDGTKAGTALAVTLTEQGALSDFRAIAGRLFFKFPNSANSFTDAQWVSDGTQAGTAQTTWPQDATISTFGTSIFLTDSTGIYRGDKGHSHLIATLPADASPGAVAQLGDRYFFPLSYTDPDTGESKDGLWFYQQ